MSYKDILNDLRKQVGAKPNLVELRRYVSSVLLILKTDLAGFDLKDKDFIKLCELTNAAFSEIGLKVKWIKNETPKVKEGEENKYSFIDHVILGNYPINAFNMEVLHRDGDGIVIFIYCITGVRNV